jgi:hypothetical protein
MYGLTVNDTQAAAPRSNGFSIPANTDTQIVQADATPGDFWRGAERRCSSPSPRRWSRSTSTPSRTGAPIPASSMAPRRGRRRAAALDHRASVTSGSPCRPVAWRDRPAVARTPRVAASPVRETAPRTGRKMVRGIGMSSARLRSSSRSSASIAWRQSSQAFRFPPSTGYPHRGSEASSPHSPLVAIPAGGYK